VKAVGASEAEALITVLGDVNCFSREMQCISEAELDRVIRLLTTIELKLTSSLSSQNHKVFCGVSTTNPHLSRHHFLTRFYHHHAASTAFDIIWKN
jgi:hypothetical protein